MQTVYLSVYLAAYLRHAPRIKRGHKAIVPWRWLIPAMSNTFAVSSSRFSASLARLKFSLRASRCYWPRLRCGVNSHDQRSRKYGRPFAVCKLGIGVIFQFPVHESTTTTTTWCELHKISSPLFILTRCFFLPPHTVEPVTPPRRLHSFYIFIINTFNLITLPCVYLYIVIAMC